MTQQLQVTFIFKVKHYPENNEKHLAQVLRSTLKAKGLELNENNEVYI